MCIRDSVRGEEPAAGWAPAERLRLGRGPRPSSPGGGFRFTSGHDCKVPCGAPSIQGTGMVEGTTAPLP
eukprot:8499645-Alexandrium_andersonii.AAC.1